MDTLVMFEAIKGYLLALIGGLVGYLLNFLKEKRKAESKGEEADIDYTHMFIYVIVGGFIGSLVEPIVPIALEEYKGAIVGVSAMFAVPLTGMLEARLPAIVDKKLGLDKEKE